MEAKLIIVALALLLVGCETMPSTHVTVSSHYGQHYSPYNSYYGQRYSPYHSYYAQTFYFRPVVVNRHHHHKHGVIPTTESRSRHRGWKRHKN